jgi:hypothetical protein
MYRVISIDSQTVPYVSSWIAQVSRYAAKANGIPGNTERNGINVGRSCILEWTKMVGLWLLRLLRDTNRTLPRYLIS